MPAALGIRDGEAFLQGRFNSDWYWQNNKLKIKSQFTDLSYSVPDSESFKNININADLAWDTQLVGNILSFDFKAESQLELLSSKQEFVAYLSQQELAEQLISLIKDNEFSQLILNPVGLISVNFSTDKVTIDSLTVSSLSSDEFSEDDQEKLTPLNLLLSDIEFLYQQELVGNQTSVQVNSNKTFASLKQAKFSVATELVVEAIKPFSEHLVAIKASGTVSQQNDTWQLMLEPSSQIQLSQLNLTPIDINEKRAAGAKVAKLISNWQGGISLDTDGILQLDLQSTNKVERFILPNIAQLEDTRFTIDLSGNLEKININGELTSDDVSLAKLVVNGDIYQPDIQLSADKLLVTDLLALKVKLPIALQLIDGTLSYQLSGQLANFKQGISAVINSPMELSLSLEDVTGEIEGTWMQEVSWMQGFIIENRGITSIPSDESNLSIAKIETATAITELLVNTSISIEDGDLRIKAKNVSGNLLGGSFLIENLFWPLKKEHSAHIQLEMIDLEQLLELDKKQGIVVTGKISGYLPLFTDGVAFLVKNGELHNVGDGVIQVYNNPAVEELKASGTQLKLAFDALENLHYHQLYSSVSMADDGYMLLDTVIKGINPDLDNEVNLNLNLSYDLLGLLESLYITEQFEKKVIESLQKN